MIKAVADQLRNGDSVLDIGAGVGVLGFEFVAKGATAATLVDASPACLDAARREAERRQLAYQVEFVSGDFTTLAAGIASADVVTLHRVICCYPDYASLLNAAANHSRRLVAVSYPRDRWYVRFWVAVENLRRRLFGNGFRTFVHSPAAMEALITDAGFSRVRRRFTPVWCVDVFVRPGSSKSQPAL